ncbi:MAG TPA: hypothetical protein VNY53_01285 [Bradyrhizobium sp.]|jgi:hypothetical protein|nr:hypothetical protein [Bradyrhizobium sp.]
MAEDAIASIFARHQPRTAKSAVPRARAYRQRRRQKPKRDTSSDDDFSESLIPAGYSWAEPAFAEPPVAPSPAGTSSAGTSSAVRHLRRPFASILLALAAIALAGVGITTNGWFARSLGSSDIAGWLFFAIGVAADLVALVMPSCAAALWQARHRAISLAGWSVWTMTFVFAVTAGIGFASVNITDVTAARAARVTPAVTAAQSALSDAMSARDRECRNGVGKFCREREAAVAERRQILDAAMASVGQTADPQTNAAIKLVAWVTQGMLRPTSDDFAMLRLVLLALLPQVGGILLMVSRSAMRPGAS